MDEAYPAAIKNAKNMEQQHRFIQDVHAKVYFCTGFRANNFYVYYRKNYFRDLILSGFRGINDLFLSEGPRNKPDSFP
jgi:hypothetical protein